MVNGLISTRPSTGRGVLTPSPFLMDPHSQRHLCKAKDQRMLGGCLG